MGVAQRASMLRAAGVPLIEYLDVTAEVYRQFMLKVRGVLDEEREKMSWMYESNTMELDGTMEKAI